MNFAYDAQQLGQFDISALRSTVAALGDDDWNADLRTDA
jgi:hypothetical protein